MHSTYSGGAKLVCRVRRVAGTANICRTYAASRFHAGRSAPTKRERERETRIAPWITSRRSSRIGIHPPDRGPGTVCLPFPADIGVEIHIAPAIFLSPVAASARRIPAIINDMRLLTLLIHFGAGRALRFRGESSSIRSRGIRCRRPPPPFPFRRAPACSYRTVASCSYLDDRILDRILGSGCSSGVSTGCDAIRDTEPDPGKQ